MPKWLQSLLRALLPAVLEWLCPQCGCTSKRKPIYDEHGNEATPYCLRCSVPMKRAEK